MTSTRGRRTDTASGDVPNFVGHVISNTTVNANGEVTDQTIEVHLSC